MRCTRLVVLACLAGCGVRAPAPIDVDALLRSRGPVEARRDLVIRVTADPKDVAGQLALAAVAEKLGRPSEALTALEVVVALGGPFGTRWHADDRVRLARLLAARGRARLVRGAASARADLERARGLGAVISDAELRQARVAEAIAALRHSDAEVRATGRSALAAEAGSADLDPGGDWRGAKAGAIPAHRGQFGAWLWQRGARRAAWDELVVWHRASSAPRDGGLEDAYLAAARWWTPLDLPLPGGAADPPVGPLRCAFVACAPHEIVGDDASERAYLMAPLAAPVRDPAEVTAVIAIALHQALRGEAPWGASLAARLDLAALAVPSQLAALSAAVRPIIVQLAGHEAGSGGGGGTTAPEHVPAAGQGPGRAASSDRAAAAEPGASAADRGSAAPADLRLIEAAGRVLAGSGTGALADLEAGGYTEALRAIAAPPARRSLPDDPRAEAVARLASRLVPGMAPPEALRAIAAAYRRDPLIADRLGRDAVAASSDAAAMHAILGAVFDALGDPARARSAWQMAVDASAEPAFVRGLAEAQARQGDGDAALISATSAAAASGDPAVVWTAVAEALAGSGRDVEALDAARNAIELAGPETAAAALEAGIAASRALDREGQAAQLTARRASVAPVAGQLGDRDPTDAAAALDADRAHPGDASTARLWIASRWNPRNAALRGALIGALPAGDPRRAVATAELIELAGSDDRAVGRAAAAALR